MKTITITAKRQATLPAALCEELGVGPGDKLEVERRTIGDEVVWLVRGREVDWSWYGAARDQAQGKSHAWNDIERSIVRGMSRGAGT